jgi:hypothetical protein
MHIHVESIDNYTKTVFLSYGIFYRRAFMCKSNGRFIMVVFWSGLTEHYVNKYILVLTKISVWNTVFGVLERLVS